MTTPDENEPANVITLTEARSRYRQAACRHTRIEVDEDLAQVLCKDCGALLNPVAMLVRFAREETRLEHAREAAKAAQAKLDLRILTTCQHCGKMTSITR